MDNYTLMLIDLIKKYKSTLVSSHEYILCNKLLEKIEKTLLEANSDNINLFTDKIGSFNDDEISMFSSPRSKQIIFSMRENLVKRKITLNTILAKIKELQNDLIENKVSDFDKKIESLESLSKIIESSEYKTNYDLLLEFIKISLDNKLISLNDAIELQFYILKKCNSYDVVRKQVDEIEEDDLESEIVELDENTDSEIDIRKQLDEIFVKYGYVYDSKKFRNLDEKFVKYAKISYVDYVLSKFMEYDIDEEILYTKIRAFCAIVIDNDKDTFNSILDFIDNNECSLKSLLSIPAAFAKRKRNYVSREMGLTGPGNDIFAVVGANRDFFENINLYKKLTNVQIINDSNLVDLGKYLTTPSWVVRKNLNLLRKYEIVPDGKFPKSAISLCGSNTEYLIDRYIEAGLYESCLQPRINWRGEYKEPRSTSALERNTNPFSFYKIKRATDFGESVLSTNGGIRRELTVNSTDYMGLKIRDNEDGIPVIVQDELSLEVMDRVPFEIRKTLTDNLQKEIDKGIRIEPDKIGTVYFKNLYEYKTFSPKEIFAASDKSMKTELKGEIVENTFSKDFDKLITVEDNKEITSDWFIKLLDNTGYLNGDDGKYIPLKTSDIKYEFSHPTMTNHKVIISRYKVLRLCKLLKDNGCWINEYSSDIDKENTLLSVLIKDSILSESELILMRFAVREILTNGYIKTNSVIVDEVENERGAR